MGKRFSQKFTVPQSANKGAGHWLGQRISAVVLTFLGLWFVWSVVNGLGQNFDQTIAWLQTPKNYVLSLLLFVSLLYHMYLGLEVIIDDYIHISFWHTFSHFLLRFFSGVLLVTFLWNLYSIVF